MNNHFSLLTYNYKNTSIYSKSNYYAQKSSIINIGDYIQSLAAKQYLPYVSGYIDRDSLAYNTTQTNLIMNGWYQIYDGNRFIPDSINALVTSLYIYNQKDIPDSFLESLKRFQPIGCRDLATCSFLQQHKLEAYFSSCLTTTLDLKYKKNQNLQRKGILFVDFPFIDIKHKRLHMIKNLFFSKNKYKNIEKISSCIPSILKMYDTNQIEYIRHIYDLGIDHSTLFKIAERHIHKYANAELVFTTRIHCALPCLALGTPVVLLIPQYDKTRFSGLSDLFNIIGFDTNGKFIHNITTNHNMVTNNNTYKSYAENLKTSCSTFVENILKNHEK